MHSAGLTATLLAAATFVTSTLASPILNTRSTHTKRASGLELAVYWGQGPNQASLATFCQDATIDFIPIGFVNIFPDQIQPPATTPNGYPGTNYGNACGSAYWIAPDGTQTKMFLTCDQLAADIQTCQNAGKKILVSLGGDSPGNFIASSTSAQNFADFLWGSYGPPVDSTQTAYPRPFGNTIVDGFDLDIESGGDSFYSDLVNELRVKFQTSAKQFYISGAPQCIVPDAHLDSAITNSLFDIVWVQYYNTDQCSAASLFNAAGTLAPAVDNTDLSFGWIAWLEANSLNKAVKLYVGLPASLTAAHSQDYLDLDEATTLINAFACNQGSSPIFGGIMLWEATYSADNVINGQSYAANIKNILNNVNCPPSGTTSSSTTIATSTTTIATSTTTAAPVTTTTSTTLTTLATTSSTTSTPPYVPSTTSSSSTTTTATTATTATTSNQVGPIGGSTSTSSTTTPIPIPTTTTTTTTAPSTTTTTTTKTTTTTGAVGPIGGSTTTTWSWSNSTTTRTRPSTTTAAVGPISNTASTSVYSNWEDWTTPASASVTAGPDYTTTVWVTSYIDICPTGFTTKTFTLTTTVTVAPTGAKTTPFVWPTATNGCPEGFTTTVTSCDVCAETIIIVTLTIPIATTTAAITQTVVPVELPSPTGEFYTVTGAPHPFAPAPAPTPAPAAAPANVVEAASAAPSGKKTISVTPVSPAQTSAASNSGWLGMSGSTPVSPVSPATFTGGAASDQLPGAALSVVVCVAVAVVGLFI